MSMYAGLSPTIQERIKQDARPFDRSDTPVPVRRNPNRDSSSIWRPAYIRDVEKIINCPYYNRYADKTQVFSFYKNDDISRRALHVQLVSRIARNIGRLLNLNLDLIEAIALGHDLGHTPFGHAGESILNRIFHQKTGRYFHHNLQSVRVLDKIFNYNVSLQTLDGIACHNGELAKKEYRPLLSFDFDKFDKRIEAAQSSENPASMLIPSTLEGCVVRISDIIAYIGKDRQDALKTKELCTDEIFYEGTVGRYNASILNNLIVNIIENSYGKDRICMDDEHFKDLQKAKAENYSHIYMTKRAEELHEIIEPMFCKIYDKLLYYVNSRSSNSVIYKHHIDLVINSRRYYHGDDYSKTEPNQMVVDHIASMTDDYFIDLYDYLFPGEANIKYVSYFDDL